MPTVNKNKGAIQLIPLLILALIVVGVTSFKTTEKRQQNQAKVLSEESENEGDSSGKSGSGSSGSGGEENKDSEKSSGTSTTVSVSTSSKLTERRESSSGEEDESDEDEKEDIDDDLDDVDENEVEDEGDDEEQTESEFTKIRAEENNTRLERVFFENGVKKKVELRNENGRVRVRVKTETAGGIETSQTLDLTPEDGKVTLTIEEGGIERSVTVKSLADRFVIEQEGFEVPTNFPITVDTQTNTISVETTAGIVNVRELPASAIQNVLASNVIDEVESTELAEPQETEVSGVPSDEQIVYRVKGTQKAKLLGVFSVNAPILAEVSALTGEQTFVSEPWYLRAFGFLFTK